MKFRQKQHISFVLIVLVISIVLLFVWYVILPFPFFQLFQLFQLSHQNDHNSLNTKYFILPSISIDHPKKNEESDGLKVQWPPIVDYSSLHYPQYRTLLDAVETWNPDDPDPPKLFIETLQHFNYSNLKERQMAEVYREAEVPFKLYDIPEIDQVRRKWTNSYLITEMESEHPHVEKSKSNHFMYWTKPKRGLPHDYIPPTESINMEFHEWLSIAKNADKYKEKQTNESTHYYYMVGSRPGDRGKSFLARDLSFFSTPTPNFFITNPKANKGIQCRFAMRGVISESHYDSGKNMIAMMHGAKRYILTPPHTCKYLGIISDKHHPSFRHSIIDWSSVEQAKAHHFDQVDAIDTIVQEGEILYVPSFWFHYIIALNYAIQCNSRSGFPKDMNGVKDIESSDCMNTKIARVAQPKQSTTTM